MNTLHTRLLILALMFMGLSVCRTAAAENVCLEAGGVSPISIVKRDKDTVTIHWFHDGSSICREAYNVSLGLVGQAPNQQFEVPGASCPTVPPFGEPQRACSHTLSVPCCMRHRISVQACHSHTGLGASSQCSKWRSIDVGDVYAVSLTQPNGAIYSIGNNNDLLWYGHEGRNDGTFRWSVNSERPELNGRKVGNGWNVKNVFSGGDGIVYAINQNDDLMWYRHEGRNDGTFRWTFNEGKKVGNGWSVKHVFSGGNGVIYAINQNDDLMWYRHEGRNDGTFRWTFNEGKKVGNGWSVKHVFSGGNGVIYAINQNDELMWYRHEGRNDGTFRWAFNEGKKVGNGWNVKHVFSGGDGIIYAITQNDDLMWYRHEGRNDGTFRWTFNEGKKVGNGWNVKHVFSGATLAP